MLRKIVFDIAVLLALGFGGVQCGKAEPAALPATVWGVAVVCAPGGGHYAPATRTITLPNSDCHALRAAPSYDPRRAYIFKTVIALYDLAHEEGHAHDPLNAERSDCSRAGACEAYADCYAAGHIEALARTFGFSSHVARRFRNLAHGQRAAHIGYSTIPQRCWK
jgi:hypothetical protein